MICRTYQHNIAVKSSGQLIMIEAVVVLAELALQ